MIKKLILKENEIILLQIIDNGTGFTQRESKHRFGLKTMEERANSAQGVLQVQSDIGSGTIVSCQMPCLEPEKLKKKPTKFIRADGAASQ